MDLAEKLEKIFYKTFNINKPKNTLYHYTSFSGLEGILKSKTFWLTDYRYLNDSSEITHSRDEVLNIIKEIIPNLPPSRMWINFLNYFNMLPYIHIFYVFSTCKKRDYLPAWRAYANDGAGFAIGIKPNLFFQSRSSNTKRYISSARVHYDIKFIRKYLKNLFKRINANTSHSNENDLIGIIISNLIAVYPLKKHPSYREEHEYRLFEFEDNPEEHEKINFSRNIIIPEENKIWCPNKNSECPFVNSIPRVITPKFDPDHITEIWIGPRCNKEHGRSEIQKLLDEYGYTQTKIKFSAIPYK